MKTEFNSDNKFYSSFLQTTLLKRFYIPVILKSKLLLFDLAISC